MTACGSASLSEANSGLLARNAETGDRLEYRQFQKGDLTFVNRGCRGGGLIIGMTCSIYVILQARGNGKGIRRVGG